MSPRRNARCFMHPILSQAETNLFGIVKTPNRLRVLGSSVFRSALIFLLFGIVSSCSAPSDLDYVKLRKSGDGSTMSNGLHGLFSLSNSDRYMEYKEIKAVVVNWISGRVDRKIGGKEIRRAALAGGAITQQSNQRQRASSAGGNESDDSLVGVWVAERDGSRLEIGLAPDRTMSYSMNDKMAFGTYILAGGNVLELWLIEKPGRDPVLVRLMYRLEGRSLTLTELSKGADEPPPNVEAVELVRSDRKVPASLGAPQATSEAASDLKQTPLIEQLQSGIQLSAGAKAAVTEFVLDKDRFPDSNAEAGLSEAASIAGKYVSSIEVTNGLIVITYGNSADQPIRGRNILLEPARRLGDGINYVEWKCYSDPAISHYAPRECQDSWQSSQSNQRIEAESSAHSTAYPKLLFSLPPVYPARAKSRGIEGVVRVRYSVDVDGKPKDVIVMYSTSSIFDKAAVASILERRYEPPGEVVSGLTDEVEFKLD